MSKAFTMKKRKQNVDHKQSQDEDSHVPTEEGEGYLGQRER